jgi:hypothetical protein
VIEKIGRTLEELYDTYIKDFSKFLQLTNGLLLKETCNGQLMLVFIEDFDDLSDYLDYTVIQIDEDNSILQIVVKE